MTPTEWMSRRRILPWSNRTPTHRRGQGQGLLAFLKTPEFRAIPANFGTLPGGGGSHRRCLSCIGVFGNPRRTRESCADSESEKFLGSVDVLASQGSTPRRVPGTPQVILPRHTRAWLLLRTPRPRRRTAPRAKGATVVRAHDCFRFEACRREKATWTVVVPGKRRFWSSKFNLRTSPTLPGRSGGSHRNRFRP